MTFSGAMAHYVYRPGRETMDGTERIILMGFVSEPSTPRDLADLQHDVRLAGILLRRGLVTHEGLEAAAKLRRETGLLLEHCLVRVGAVEFDAMLEAMAERREMEAAAQAQLGPGDVGHGAACPTHARVA